VQTGLLPVGAEGAIMAQITPNGPFPVTDLITEAQRELDLRRQFYWSRVRARKMRRAEADKRIALMPATKLVLWHLCDRHNPDFGCFPSQDQLAAMLKSRARRSTPISKSWKRRD
jgi:hypothetical protein